MRHLGPLFALLATCLARPSFADGIAAGLVLPDTIGQPSYEITRTLREVPADRPLQVFTAPGNDQYLFALERRGTVLRIDQDNPENFAYIVDIQEAVHDYSAERGLVSAAFHPDFPNQPYLYLYYTLFDVTEQGDGGYMRLSRVTVDPDTFVADLETERVYIHQFDPIGEHQGGTICFGPEDGYLYLGLGDGGKGVGAVENTQQIDRDFFGVVIRIDVDEKPENLLPNPHPASYGGYRIPADNPFIGATSFNGLTVDPNNVRTEFWAVGLRNPFRMRFDEDSNELWLGDVGWSTWEELNRIEAGKNYGWPYFEADSETTIRDDKPENFTYESPVWAYDHNVGNAIIVGRKYTGSKFPELYGKLMVLDFIRGILWAFDTEHPEQPPEMLLQHRIGITDIMVDPRDGGILFCGQNSQNYQTLERTDGSGGQAPEKLSDIGAFDESQFPLIVPKEGIQPYEINVPFWSDHAIKSRFVALPENAAFEYSNTGNWTFPTGTVWIKHFEIESRRGDPSSRRNLETRFLVKTDSSTYGLSYRWNEEQTDAFLVAPEGLTEPFPIVTENQLQQEQKWLYPSTANCAACHTEAGGHAIGFNTGQLNRDGSHAWSDLNQIEAMQHFGWFSNEADIPAVRPSMARADDSSASLTHRVKSYLQANCVQCHQPGGDVIANWDARLATPTRESSLINSPSVRGGDDPNEAIIVPGSPENSILFQRISSHENRMPPLGSFELDQSAIALLEAWILDESEQIKSYEAWAETAFANPELSAADLDPDHDGLRNFDEFVLGTDPNDPASDWNIHILRIENQTTLKFAHPANRGVIVESRDSADAEWKPVELGENGDRTSFPNVEKSVELPIPDPDSAPALYRARVLEP